MANLRVFNLFLNVLKKNFNLKSRIKIKKLGFAEMNISNCDISKFQKKFKYKPNTKIEFGVQKFIDWFKEYKKLN